MLSAFAFSLSFFSNSAKASFLAFATESAAFTASGPKAFNAATESASAKDLAFLAVFTESSINSARSMS